MWHQTDFPFLFRHLLGGLYPISIVQLWAGAESELTFRPNLQTGVGERAPPAPGPRSGVGSGRGVGNSRDPARRRSPRGPAWTPTTPGPRRPGDAGPHSPRCAPRPAHRHEPHPPICAPRPPIASPRQSPCAPPCPSPRGSPTAARRFPPIRAHSPTYRRAPGPWALRVRGATHPFPAQHGRGRLRGIGVRACASRRSDGGLSLP